MSKQFLAVEHCLCRFRQELSSDFCRGRRDIPSMYRIGFYVQGHKLKEYMQLRRSKIFSLRSNFRNDENTIKIEGIGH
jgi:hypothetical protein